MRTVKAHHVAVRDDIEDLVTRRALPTNSLSHLDPFLFLNHHGPQIYESGNLGLPFGPHPHRGFQTVTFILKGSLAHKDSGGHESIIYAGGVQWMTAGRGLIHSEISPDDFKRTGGSLEILQLWVNLPSQLKMTDPQYLGLQADAIPHHQEDEGRVDVGIIAGVWNGHIGAFKPLIDIQLLTLQMSPGGKIQLSVAAKRNIFFYIVNGSVKVNGSSAGAFQLIEFERDGESVDVEALEDSFILFGQANPFEEPIVAHGPFVMNSKQEILKAIMDYQAGHFEK